MEKKISCPLCGQPEEASVSKDDGYIGEYQIEINCNMFGKIYLDIFASSIIYGKDGYKFTSSLYYFFNHFFKKNNEPLYIVNEKNKSYENFENVVLIKEIFNLYPNNYSDTIDKILLNFKNLSQGIGDTFIIKKGNMSSNIFFINNDVQTINKINEILNIMQSKKLVRNISFSNENISICLDSEGWNRIDELQKYNTINKKAFIAMSFAPALEGVKDSIKYAVDQAGYFPSVIIEKEHNNEIMPEIYYEIKTSDFLVADLTGNRGGVYLEAGYALGLGKQVIFTVNEEDLKDNEKKPHFDVEHRNQVRYSTMEELKDKLFNRIISTVGHADKNIIVNID